MATPSVYDERAVDRGLTGEKVACTLLSGDPEAPLAQVTIEVHLPPGVDPGRYEHVKSEVTSSADYLARSVA